MSKLKEVEQLKHKVEAIEEKLVDVISYAESIASAVNESQLDKDKNVIEENISFGSNPSLGHFNHLRKESTFGDNVIIGNHNDLGESLEVGNNVIIQGRVRTADNCVIEDGVTIKIGTILTSKVLLKKGCFLGPNVITLGSTHERVTKHGTIIGENTYIGAGTKIAADTHIGDNIVVGANSFVNKDLTEPGIYAGTPVKFIRPHKVSEK